MLVRLYAPAWQPGNAMPALVVSPGLDALVRPADATHMTNGAMLAAVITAIGAIILLYAFGTGSSLVSLPVLLGALCVADGVLRLLTLRHKEH